jgi:hypothetical protein
LNPNLPFSEIFIQEPIRQSYRAAGVCCSLAFWELTLKRVTASAIGNCAKGVGRPLFQRVMGQTTKRVGSQLVEQRSASLPAQKMVDSFSRVGDVFKGRGSEYVNLASKSRTNHILYGDSSGGGHLYPGIGNKSVFPKSWNSNKTMHYILHMSEYENLSSKTHHVRPFR